MPRANNAIEIAAFTDAGLARDHNEDCVGYDIKTGVAVLADGMGGHRSGEVASRVAVEAALAAPVAGRTQLEHLRGDSQMLDLHAISRPKGIHQGTAEIDIVDRQFADGNMQLGKIRRP